jgi:hypothetical protein
MKHEYFVRTFTHNIGKRHNLEGGQMKQIYDKHKPDMIGALNFLINRGDHTGTGAGLYTGGGNYTGGGMRTGGGGAGGTASAGSFFSSPFEKIKSQRDQRDGGGVGTGGNFVNNIIPKHIQQNIQVAKGGAFQEHRDPYNLNQHKDMYHHVLSLSPAHWELYREKAAQILGARPSPMWDHLPQGGSLDYESAPENYQHVLRMPNTHAAARMLEAEASSRGAGFVKALKHIHKAVRKFYPALANERLANLNPRVEKERLKSFLKPIAHSVSNIAKQAIVKNAKGIWKGNISPQEAFKNIKHAFHDTVKQHLPSLKDYAKETLGLNDKEEEAKPTKHESKEDLVDEPISVPKAEPQISVVANEQGPADYQSNHPNVPPPDSIKEAAPSLENTAIPKGGSVRRRPC